MIDTDFELLKGIANQLRIHSITATTAAGSGHPTSCCSANYQRVQFPATCCHSSGTGILPVSC